MLFFSGKINTRLISHLLFKVYGKMKYGTHFSNNLEILSKHNNKERRVFVNSKTNNNK